MDKYWIGTYSMPADQSKVKRNYGNCEIDIIDSEKNDE